MTFRALRRHFEDEPQRQMSMKRLSRDEAFLIAANIAERAAADIEGHSEAAELGQPGRLSARVIVRCTPESDRLLRCHETALWASFCRTQPQQNWRSLMGNSATQRARPAHSFRRFSQSPGIVIGISDRYLDGHFVALNSAIDCRDVHKKARSPGPCPELPRTSKSVS